MQRKISVISLGDELWRSLSLPLPLPPSLPLSLSLFSLSLFLFFSLWLLCLWKSFRMALRFWLKT